MGALIKIKNAWQSWVGLSRKKIQQNQTRILARVPVEGAAQTSRINSLLRPTFTQRPIEFQRLFPRLSHRVTGCFVTARISSALSAQVSP
jgi:hypothetical protein